MIQKTLLKDHTKYGDVLETPLLQHKIAEQIHLTSWAKDSLPEYYWIALILDYFGRQIGLNVLYEIMKELKEKNIATAEFSAILNYTYDKQKLFFDVVDNYVPKSVLTPLTMVCSNYEDTYFYKNYVNPLIPISTKLDVLIKIAKTNMRIQADSSTDICFIVVWFSIISDKVKFLDSLPGLDAYSEYPRISHTDEKMLLYRSVIRSTFQGLCELKDNYFSVSFWNELAQITRCNTLIICYEEDEYNMEFYNAVKDVLKYIEASNGDKKLEKKFEIVMGLVVYIIKLYSEIIDNNLANTISGRILLRTMIEGYINLKYILINEEEQPKIFEMYEDYGAGKVKLVNAKLREGKFEIDDNSHIKPQIIEYYVNESKDEEFVNISLGYFERSTIKKKAELVDEDLLYEIYYEYDTNYSHAFWGAIREAGMLTCDNPSHLYHPVPDYCFDQKLPTVLYDCEMVVKKLMIVISDYIELPESYVLNYMVKK